MIAQQEQFYTKDSGGPTTAPVLEAVSSAACTSIEGNGFFVPYHVEEGPFVLCWTCHGYLIGPPERRLCHCLEPAAVSPVEAEKLRTLEALRDALAETYRRRWFRVLIPLLDDADEDEARAVWDGLWAAARSRAARRMAEQGLS